MKKQFFKDFYGNTASITDNGVSHLLICKDYNGKEWMRKEYQTAKGARIALGKAGDCWHTVKY